MKTLVNDRSRTSLGMNVALWSAQTVLIVVFAWAGLAKLALPIDHVVARMGLRAGTLRFIAVTELLAAIGLDPLVTKFRASVTAFAASSLALVMALAAAYHLGRQELAMIPVNVALGTLAAFVAVGRSRQGTARNGEVLNNAPPR